MQFLQKKKFQSLIFVTEEKKIHKKVNTLKSLVVQTAL